MSIHFLLRAENQFVRKAHCLLRMFLDSLLKKMTSGLLHASRAKSPCNPFIPKLKLLSLEHSWKALCHQVPWPGPLQGL